MHRVARELLLSLACFLASVAACCGQVIGAGDFDEEIRAYLKPFEEKGHLSGHLLISRGQEVIFEASFGMADYELGVPNGPGTVFNIASITKPMTAMVVAHLLEEKKLKLEDPLSKWIPQFPRGDEITIEHLLRHRSGIPHRVTTEAEEALPKTAQEMARLAGRKELLFDPGTDRSYSSAGYSVLARVVELASGRSYPEELAVRLFRPLGMKDSTSYMPGKLIPNRASPYVLGPNGPANASYQDYSFLVGAGSVFSTAGSLRSLLDAVTTGKLGEAIWEEVLRDDGIRWSGASQGYRAFADFHRELGVDIVYTSNLSVGATDLLRRDLPRILSGEEVSPPALPDFKPIEFPRSRLRSLEGRYRLRPGFDLIVHERNGEVTASGWLLIPIGPMRFFSPNDYGVITAVEGEEGEIERLDWSVAGQVLQCPRIDDGTQR